MEVPAKRMSNPAVAALTTARLLALIISGKKKERMEAEVMIKLATRAAMDCTGERKSRAKAFLSRIHIAGFPVF